MHSVTCFDHRGLQPFFGIFFNRRIEDEAHSAASHSAQHPESPELIAPFFFALFDERIREQIGAPGNNFLQRTKEVAMRRFTDRANIAFLETTGNLAEDFDGFFASLPLDGTAEQVFLGHHFEDRPNVLSHPTVDQDQ